MKSFSFLLACAVSILLFFSTPHTIVEAQPPAPAAVTPTFRFDNGQWYDGKTFVRGTFYSVKGVFTRKAPPKVDETLDLKNGYVIPPFADAHCHHFDNPYDIAEITEIYLKDGVFYAQTQADSRSGAAKVASQVNVPTGIDVRYAHACLTSNNGHPIQIYEGLGMGYYSYQDRLTHLKEILKSRRRENDCYFIVDTEADLKQKWSQILAGKPDILKVILAHSENYEKQKKEGENGAGVDPKLLPEIVRRAHAAGLRVSVHVDSAEDYRTALRSGVDIMAHLCGYYMLPEDNIALYQLSPEDAALTTKRKVTVIPTASLTTTMDAGANKTRTCDNQIRNLKLLKDAGVRFGVGMDEYGKSSLEEALYLHHTGVWSNVEMLKMWCEDTPRLIFPKRKIGSLREGYEASFLVLDKNPLEDFNNVQTIRLRFKQGALLSATEKTADK